MPTSRNQLGRAGAIPQHFDGAGNGDTGAYNRLLVWELLRQRGPQSRSQLRELTGMGASTLTYAVRDLMGLNLVRPCGKRASERAGKKQELVEINADFGRFAGLFLEGSEVSATVIDAAGRQLDHRRLRYDRSMGGALRAVEAYLGEVLTGGDVPLGIGFAIPGVVDAQNRRIVQSWRLGVSDFDFAAAASHWGERLVLDNDVNLASWAEAEHLVASLPDSLLFVALHATSEPDGETELYGAGMSLIENGRLKSGANNGAGELDSLRALVGELRLDAGHVEALGEPDGEPDVRLVPFLRQLGRLLTVLIDLNDPSVVILGGSLMIRNKAFYAALTRQVRAARVLRAGDDVRVRPSAFGERGTATGAAMLARRGAIRELLVKLGD